MTRPSIKNAHLLDGDIPGLRWRIKHKVTTTAQEADRFGVGIETIRRAVRGETFRHISAGLEDIEPPPAIERVTEEDARASQERVKAANKAPEPSALDTYLSTHKATKTKKDKP